METEIKEYENKIRIIKDEWISSKIEEYLAKQCIDINKDMMFVPIDADVDGISGITISRFLGDYSVYTMFISKLYIKYKNIYLNCNDKEYLPTDLGRNDVPVFSDKLIKDEYKRLKKVMADKNRKHMEEVTNVRRY